MPGQLEMPDCLLARLISEQLQEVRQAAQPVRQANKAPASSSSGSGMTTSPGLLVVSINHPPTLAMIQVKRFKRFKSSGAPSPAAFHGPTGPDQAPPGQTGEGDERKRDDDE
ncbi:hypothetical protein VTJ04DRAFT_6853 [Mycothermus thermophilus]|uniref:uncharacterized protein n=1 Tax=Humicola insolens TaxID=85995 RepID=UPI003743FA0F